MAQDPRGLIERARRGDRAAFGELVRKHQRRVYITAYRMVGNHHDADDVAQEAFVRAYRGLPSFDARSDFFTWLYRIVINVSLNALRKGSRRRELPAGELEQLAQQAGPGKDPREALELKRLVGEIGEALDALPESLRATLVLVVLEGVPYRQAAEILECSEGTVAWRVHEARSQMRAKLGARLENGKKKPPGKEKSPKESSRRRAG